MVTLYPARAVLGQGHSGFVNDGLGERRQRRLDLEEVAGAASSLRL